MSSSEDISISLARQRELGALPADALRAHEASDYMGELEGWHRPKLGSFLQREGEVWQVGPERLQAPFWRRNSDAVPDGFDVEQADRLAGDYVELRNRLHRLIEADVHEDTTLEQSDFLRANLRESYDQFCHDWGRLHASDGHRQLLRSDPDFGLVCSMETVRREFVGDREVLDIQSAPILRHRLLYPTTPREVSSIQEAVDQSLSLHGSVELASIARQLDLPSKAEAESQLRSSGTAYHNPTTGEWERPDRYLSGDVVGKLAAARQAAAQDSDYYANVLALTEVQPDTIPAQDIQVELGAHWLPPEVLRRFAAKELGLRPDLEFAYDRESSQWKIEANSSHHGTDIIVADSDYEALGKSRLEILEAILNRRPIEVYSKEGSEAGTVDWDRTKKARQLGERMKSTFRDFVKSEVDFHEQIAAAFNAHANRRVPAEIRGDHLDLPFLNRSTHGFHPRPYQADAIAQAVQEQAGLIAHGVGSGKSLTLIATAMESKRTGRASKPLLVCDESSAPHMLETIHRSYPSARVLCAPLDAATDEERAFFRSQLAKDDWDLVVTTGSELERIKMAPAEARLAKLEELKTLRQAISSLQLAGAPEPELRSVEAMIEQTQTEIENLNQEMAEHPNGIYWEDLGIDLMLIDEVHKYRAYDYGSNLGLVSGMDMDEPEARSSVWEKARQIQRERGGKGVIGATGTLVSGSLLDAWSLLNLTHPKVLRESGFDSLDTVVSTFCQTTISRARMEPGGELVRQGKVTGFVNVPAFMNMLKSGMHVCLSNEQLGQEVPRLMFGAAQECYGKPGAVTEQLNRAIDEWVRSRMENESPHDQDWKIKTVAEMSILGGLDPRMLDPGFADDPESLVNRACRAVSMLYRETAETGRTQAVFLDRCEGLSSGSLEQQMREIGMEPVITPAGEGERIHLFEVIKAKLVEQGVSPHEIEVITDDQTKSEQEAALSRVKSGTSRIVIGSSWNLGTGPNIQDKLIAMHHLDPPLDLSPASMIQRQGRGLRKKNENKEVLETYYATQGSLSPSIFHELKVNAGRIQGLFNGKQVPPQIPDPGGVNLADLLTRKALPKDHARPPTAQGAVRRRIEHPLGRARRSSCGVGI